MKFTLIAVFVALAFAVSLIFILDLKNNVLIFVYYFNYRLLHMLIQNVYVEEEAVAEEVVADHVVEEVAEDHVVEAAAEEVALVDHVVEAVVEEVAVDHVVEAIRLPKY